MSQTDQLLDLMDSFPDAFKAGQSTGDSATVPTAHGDESLDPILRQLIAEFPSAFVDPVADLILQDAEIGVDSASDDANSPKSAAPSSEETTAIVNTPSASPSFVPLPLAQPGTYSQALKRQISTMTWGQVELYLTYGEGGLQSIWVTVGKSGTEVQSLCEAIARLINLSLSREVPIPDIARQIRGIRGADSEGLGPNRILGLGDLIGKVLQEAPTVLTPVQPNQTSDDTAPSESNHHGNGHTSNGSPSADILQAEAWTTIADQDHAASICPECGSELHQVNGCSGGACVVCGYSSCS